MRNWACARKGGGAEKSFLVRPVAVETVVMVAAVAVKTTATPEPVPISGDGADAIATSLSRLLFGFDIVQVSAQHGIDARIDAIGVSGFPRQHTAAAGIAETNSTKTAIIVAIRFVLDVMAGCTVVRTPAAVLVFR